MKQNNPVPELLAPAGNALCALAAFDAGADAIYCGLGKFNARERSENFTPETMGKIIAYAHSIKRKVYVTFNTVIKEAELSEVAENLALLSSLEPDALIVQDLGAARMIREYFPELTIHASTQMGFHNSAGVAAAKEFGAKRVILERQMTMDELRIVREKNPDTELEVFIHGALCCSLSGQCLFSSYLGGYSGNRGFCKQPCRRRYYSNQGNGFFFSPQDLETLELIGELRKIGVESLKIEGRLRQPDYVSNTVKAYRMILDAPDSMPTPELLGEARVLLSKSCGRKWSKGFFSEESMKNLIIHDNIGSAGMLIGTVSKIAEKGFAFTARKKIHVGDEPAIKTMFLSYAATRVNNSEGIHISITGDAGTGKSHACTTVARRLPPDYVITDRLSDKSLFYHEIHERTVILMDDQELSEDMSELLKIASTNWRTPASYRTVHNGKPVTLSIAPRCPFWICKANINGDEQILDRQILFWTDTSSAQRRAVQEALMRQAQGIDETDDSGDLVICRAIWDCIPYATVIVPFADRICCSEQLDPRNLKLMLALTTAAALMDASNRRRDSRDRILAEVKDFETAQLIFNPILQNKGGSQKWKLSAASASVLNFLAENGRSIVQFADVRRATGFYRRTTFYPKVKTASRKALNKMKESCGRYRREAAHWSSRCQRQDAFQETRQSRGSSHGSCEATRFAHQSP